MITRRSTVGALAGAGVVAPPAFAATTSSRLRAWTEKAVIDHGLPGAIAAIRLQDGSVFAAAAGWADVEKRAPMRIEHRLLGASIGKTFVSALCLRLQRTGVFRLDDPISRWLAREPWFARLPNGPALSLRMLLNHSSGLRDFIDEPEYGPLRAASLRTDWVLSSEGKLALVLDKAPLFPAGGGYSYSDTNYILVGMCIERATARAYYDLVSEHFLRPLRLKRTSPSNARRLAGLAVGYSVEGGRYARFGYPRRLIEHGLLIYNPATEWTGGGLVTNPQDLVRWIAALFSGEAIDPRDVPDLTRPAQPPATGAAYYYGQGMYVFSGAHGPMFGHMGSMAGYSGFVTHLPVTGVSIAMQANITTFDRATAQTGLAALAQGIAGGGRP